MTSKEAIRRLQHIIAYFDYRVGEDVEALNTAIEALEKQIPQKPIRDVGTYARRCTRCNHIVGSEYYCWNCGQHLSWEEEK